MTLKILTKAQRAYRILAMVFALLLCVAMGEAQTVVSVHKVKKQETIFGIAKAYGVTIDELKSVNPDMRNADFVLKKGMRLNIPQHKEVPAQPQKPVDPLTKHITVGVMLPLHDINGDGRRMAEYYRGMLLAIRDLKKEGYSVTVNAWNMAEDTDPKTVLVDANAGKCDIIFGPLYTTQVRDLADFCMERSIRLVIPFSINGDDVRTCPQIYQVYQTQQDITSASINEFLARFSDSHPVFIDCNDTNSKKGSFTFGLRKLLEERGIAYSITNLNNSPEMFRKAFASDRRNVVVLNTGRSPELGQAFQKLDVMTAADPSVRVSMFGYNEWFLYTRIYDEKLRRYDTYIPSTYNYDKTSEAVQRIEQLYMAYYKGQVQSALPRFAITGYDHANFFLRGLHTYGKEFHGLSGQRCYTPVQTPLQFEREGNGGYKNHTFMLVHYQSKK